MPVVCERFEPRHLDAVRRFNERLLAAGGDPDYVIQGVPLPYSEPPPPVWTDRILAVDGSEVRGGYLPQWRDFLAGGEIVRVGGYQTPISEGVVDKKHTAIGLVLLKHAQASNPCWFTVGMGGLDRPLPKMLRSFGWHLSLVPFRFRVHHGATFLREIRHLRTTRARRLAFDALSMSGLGWLAVQAMNTMTAARRPSMRVEVDRVERFGAWADALWTSASPEYSFAAVRTADHINTLYPSTDPRFRRLRVKVQGRDVGWAVVLRHALSDNNYFGNMTAGVIVDCFAAPPDMLPVLVAASRELDALDVDLSFANAQHPAVNSALDQLGYRLGPTNYGFGLSKKLAARLEPLDAGLARAHLMRGDGDGLSNFREEPAARA